MDEPGRDGWTRLVEQAGRMVEEHQDYGYLLPGQCKAILAVDRELTDLRQQADVAEARIAALEAACEVAYHELTTLHGLTVVDFAAYGRAQEYGADANGAYDALVDSSWTVDTSKARAALDAADKEASGAN